MNNKSKRVLWICNHTTLMEVECKLLMDLGYEVFVPKLLPNQYSINSRTANVCYDYDSSLTIPKKDLDVLNSFNFYDDLPTKDVKRILNKYFDICFCVFLFPCCANIVQIFKGKLFLRVFGHASDMSYELASTYVTGTKFINYFDKIKYEIQKHLSVFRPKNIKYFNKENFIFNNKKNLYLSAAYSNIGDNEPAFFRDKTLYMPLGLPDSIMKFQDTWNPKINEIMFVCPSIEVGYYKNIYDNFKKDFSEFNYKIFGKQSQKYDDENIIGYISRDDYNKALIQYKCMFYHSREERHLHYHPLEAIVFGMPLIYMSGGVLEMLAVDSKKIGMAKDIDEAKAKIKRILDGDENFIREVIDDNKKILKYFSYDYIKTVWKNII